MRLSGTKLACVRAGLLVFDEVSFTLGPGEALLVTGPNGSGKTTLLRLVAGLIRPTSGAIALEGAGPDASLAEELHYLAHQDALKPSLTVAENLRFWVDFLDGAGPIEPALAQVRLE